MFKSRQDDFLHLGLLGTAFISGIIIFFILFFLVLESNSALRDIGLGRFFGDPEWAPAEDPTIGFYNLTPILCGTLFSAFGAIFLAAPIGLASAIFLNFYAPQWLGKIFKRLVELMAGIPSVVYGFWGLVVLVPILQRIQPPGQSLLAGIFILCIMILPTVILLSEAAIASTSQDTLLGAAALGLSRWSTLTAVILPSSKSGLITASILATGRAIGETMAILMVCGNIVKYPRSLFDPIRTLTSNIALEMAYAIGHHRSALFMSGLVLTLLVVILIILAEMIFKGKVYS